MTAHPYTRLKTPAFGAFALGFAGACAAEDAAGTPPDEGAGDDRPECLTPSECPTGHTCSDFGTCIPIDGAGDAGVPAEVELSFEPPASAIRYVFVAMPEIDALAQIDGETLEVSTLEVGRAPQVVAASPTSDTAISLDPHNAAATIVRPGEGGTDKAVVPTLPNLNEVTWGPEGRFALAWFDLAKALAEAGSLDPIGDVGSLQHATLIALGQDDEPDASVDLTVGFEPRRVVFDEAGERAFAITRDGVSVIDLEAAAAGETAHTAPIPISDDPFADPDDFEVLVTPSGPRALVREQDRAELGIVELAGDDAGERRAIPLSSEPTDLELDPSGERALAVLRESAELAIVSPGEIAAEGDEENGDGEIDGVEIVELDAQRPVGSIEVSPDGERGLLYTNAEARAEITTVDLSGPPYERQVFPLEKAVRTVAFAPDGDSAIVIHRKAPGDPESAQDRDEMLERSYGYSILSADTGFSRLELTPQDPEALAFTRERPAAYLILRGDGEEALPLVHDIDLDSFVVGSRDLASPPMEIGLLRGPDAPFVAQRHPLGRVSFLEPESGEVRTVTGFDLDGRIVE